MQSRLMYTLWLLFSAIYFLKGASTGKLSKAARSKRYWTLSANGRLLCLLAGAVCVVGTVIVFLSIFPRQS